MAVIPEGMVPSLNPQGLMSTGRNFPTVRG